ncbi:MAG: (d)CMP kinase [Candidatus Latescibacterota bacterium]|nr:(d)CMP kinase [Candidatus Latescibacterota bacterium]
MASRPGGLIIAIDGVIGAGKSSTARGVAAALAYRHLDTGAMYRAFALAAMRRSIEARDSEGVAQLLVQLDLTIDIRDGEQRVLLDGEDVSDEIRRPEVAREVGAFADVTLVRLALIERQRSLGSRGGVVADGRDAGSVVFPDADLKVRMTADLDERARRRYRELIEKGVSTSLELVAADIRRRDREDEARDYGARHDPAETLELDTTELTVSQQIDGIVSWARQRGA